MTVPDKDQWAPAGRRPMLVALIVFAIVFAAGALTGWLVPRPSGPADTWHRNDAAQQHDNQTPGLGSNVAGEQVPNFDEEGDQPFSVRFRLRVGAPADGLTHLFVRNIEGRVTSHFDLQWDADRLAATCETNLLPGRYMLSASTGYRLDHNYLDVRRAGVTLDSGTLQKHGTEVVLFASTSVSIRFTAESSAGSAVTGRLELANHNGWTAGTVSTGDTFVYDVPRDKIYVTFWPDSSVYETHRSTLVISPEETENSLHVTLPILERLNTRVYFTGYSGDPNMSQAVQLEGDGVTKSIESPPGMPEFFRVVHGGRLPAQYFRKPGVYEMAWIRDGAVGPAISLNRADLAALEEVWLLPPENSGGPVLRVVSPTGEPAPGVEFEARFQGPGGNEVRVVSDSDGLLRLPQWDRSKFTLYLEPLIPDACDRSSYTDPYDGDRIVHDPSLVTARLIVSLDESMFRWSRGGKLQIQFWASPDCSLEDWQLAARLSDAQPEIKIRERRITVSDVNLKGLSIQAPEHVRASLRIRGSEVWSAPILEYVKFQRKQLELTSLQDSDQAVELHLDSRGDISPTIPWKLAPGYADISDLISTHLSALKRDWMPVWNAAEHYAEYNGAAGSMRLRWKSAVMSGISERGDLALFTCSWNGREATLSPTQVWKGGVLEVADLPDVAGRVALNTHFYYVADGEGGARFCYWDETGLVIKSDALPFQLSLPSGVPFLFAPLYENGGLTDPKISDINKWVFRVKAGASTQIAIRD